MLIKGLRIALMLFAGVALMVYSTIAQEASLRKAEVASVEGLVAISGPEEVDWIEAHVGTTLRQGDRIRTGPLSSADIKLDSGTKESLVRVDADSELTIDEMLLDETSGRMSTTLDLAIGKVMIKAAHLEGESEFEVTTPTSIVGVRGTGFEVRVSALE